MAWSPSGKARVCKTLIRRFDSAPGLKQTFLVCVGSFPFLFLFVIFQARVVELVYTHDLKSCGEIHAGSIPAPGTTITFDLLFYSFHSWIESSRFVSEIFRKFILSQNLITKCAAAHFVIINKLVIINQS